MKSFAAVLLLAAATRAFAACPAWSVPSSAYLAEPGPELLIADFDGDGRRDVLSYSIGLRIAYGGDTGVSRARDLPDATFGQFFSAAVADLNRDGRTDLIVARANGQPDHAIELFLNRGLAAFSPEPLSNIFANRLATANLDGDPYPDLVIIGGQGNELITFLGDGKEGFFPPQHSGFTAAPLALAVGDFNGDKFSDVAVVDPNRPTVVVTYAGDGKGGLQLLASRDLTRNVQSLTVVEVDGDGRSDLAAITDRVEVLRSNLQPLMQLADVASPQQVVAADFDHDGANDLAVRTNQLVAIWLNNGRGTFRRMPDAVSNGPRIFAIAAADFTADAVPDLLVQTADLLRVLPSAVNGTFRRTSPLAPVNAFGTATGDLDADGDTDVVSGDLTLWRNTSGTLVPQTFGELDDGRESLVLADLDADGRPEIITAGPIGDQSSLSIYRLGGPTPVRIYHTTIEGSTIGFAAGDFDADGRKEVLMYTASGIASWIAADPTPHIVRQVSLPPNSVPAFALDFDADRRDDLVLNLPDSVTVARSLGAGFETPRTITAFSLEPFMVRSGDFDGDGKRDLVIAGYSDLRIAYANGGFSFDVRQLQPRYPLGRLFTADAIADIDGDGRDDIAGLQDSYGPLVEPAVFFLGARGEWRRISFAEQDAGPQQSYIYQTVALAEIDGMGGLELIAFGPGKSVIHPGLCASTAHRRPRR